MNLGELRPGMEELDLEVTIISIEEPREIETHRGKKHILVDGMVQDDVTSRELTVWNETISELEGIKPGNKVILINCFISSFKGVLSVNVGRDSRIEKL
jgi:ssDNA-binding replication factor A large subunit